ncbi:MAG TPA: 50S ribosomal protein L11 methyltransferase [Ottowia sp.]|nr:50S ribosomal protein L11 methyltransferase [Pseudomonadota bacterium]HOV20210.1 50S ribosomal protein L11 methyltransferase [Ottowia sp.]
MFELRLACAESAVESISDALEALDALSVSAEDADADTGAEQALFGEPGLPPPAPGWSRTTVLALFSDESAAREAAALLAAQDFFAGATIQSIAPVPEQDWVRLTQAQFEPVAVTPQFWIVPSWHAVPAAARQVIRLDPGLAFGTGTHPTTRMCLRWIAAHAPLGPRVLDYGCGSGILAIGAALHGAQSVDAVDIDPAAVQATQANAAANGVQLRAGLPDAAHGLYDTVLANILATPLKVLAPLLCAHVAAGGALVLAGVLERQTEELRAAYAPWLALQASDHEDGWVLLTAERPR